jgi:rhodanese-related sulfurtransferase
MDAANSSPISPSELSAWLLAFPPATLVDVRSAETSAQAPQVPGALRLSSDADALGHARPSEDRPHRLSVARPPLSRSVGALLRGAL